jgi:hypothetical protein
MGMTVIETSFTLVNIFAGYFEKVTGDVIVYVDCLESFGAKTFESTRKIFTFNIFSPTVVSVVSAFINIITNSTFNGRHASVSIPTLAVIASNVVCANWLVIAFVCGVGTFVDIVTVCNTVTIVTLVTFALKSTLFVNAFSVGVAVVFKLAGFFTFVDVCTFITRSGVTR